LNEITWKNMGMINPMSCKANEISSTSLSNRLYLMMAQQLWRSTGALN
jgi:hypothetical protein